MSEILYRSRIPPLVSEPLDVAGAAEVKAPDRRDGRVYLLDDELRLAVEVALATGRPLLLRGEPGSGKSSLAAFIARNLGWRYYEHVVTSSTHAQDLLWRFDHVRRLSDAQARRGAADPLEDFPYVEPGVLWWAFDPTSAQRRGAAQLDDARSATDPHEELNRSRDQERAVVLIDEIDKADPDVPNGLLVPLSSTTFHVSQLGIDVEMAGAAQTGSDLDALSRLLVVITTNEERDLPPAFLRRCVDYALPGPDAERLVAIARLHLEGPGRALGSAELALIGAVAERVQELRDEAQRSRRRQPSTAEYLDAVRACRVFGIEVGESAAWEQVERVTLGKARAEE